LAEAFDEELFERKLRRLAEGYKKRYGDLLKYDVEDEIARWRVRPRCAFRGREGPSADLL
jgi:adenylosuccinate synthase